MSGDEKRLPECPLKGQCQEMGLVLRSIQRIGHKWKSLEPVSLCQPLRRYNVSILKCVILFLTRHEWSILKNTGGVWINIRLICSPRLYTTAPLLHMIYKKYFEKIAKIEVFFAIFNCIILRAAYEYKMAENCFISYAA